jgi:hypothetical protein
MGCVVIALAELSSCYGRQWRVGARYTSEREIEVAKIRRAVVKEPRSRAT